jgi:hypothetical protein
LNGIFSSSIKCANEDENWKNICMWMSEKNAMVLITEHGMKHFEKYLINIKFVQKIFFGVLKFKFCALKN